MIVGAHSIILIKYQTHLGINNYSPEGRPVQAIGTIDKIPFVNGLHHYYFRQAA
jgi:hypothetical protein